MDLNKNVTYYSTDEQNADLHWRILPSAGTSLWILSFKDKMGIWYTANGFPSAEAAAKSVATNRTNVPAWDNQPHDETTFDLSKWKAAG